MDLLSGRGVGLFVVKNELDKIGGDVIIESKKNEGTQFIFTLPTKNESQIVEYKNHKELNYLSKNTMQKYYNISNKDYLKYVFSKNISFGRAHFFDSSFRSTYIINSSKVSLCFAS